MPKLTEEEKAWLDSFTSHIYKKPKALSLIISPMNDWGNVEVYSQLGKLFTPAQKRWIDTLEEMIANFPDTPEFWMLSNIDGWNIGKGYPSEFHGSGYGSWGATATYRDNYSDFYVESFCVDYGDVPEEERDECDRREIKSNRGDLRVWYVDGTTRKLR